MLARPVFLLTAATTATALPQTFVLDPNFALGNTETLEDAAIFNDIPLPPHTSPLDDAPAPTLYADTEPQPLNPVSSAGTTDQTPPVPPRIAAPTPSVPPVYPGAETEGKHWPAWVPAATFMLVFYDLATVALFVWLWACGHLVWLGRTRAGETGERTVVGDREREERRRWEREARRMGLY